MPDAPISAPAATPSAAPSAAPASSPAPSAPASAPTPDTATAAAPESKPPEPPKRYKFKSGGEDREIDAAHVDALAEAWGLDPAEILKGAGMAQSSYQRWQEAARLRKEAEEAQKAAKARYEDPRIADIKAKDPSLSDEDAWAFLRVQEMYERSQMSPDQKALAEERQRRMDLERANKERDEKDKAAKTEAETKTAAAQVDRELVAAMQKHALPKNPAWARAVLDHMAAAVRAGEVPDVEASTLYVKRLVQKDDQARLAALSDEGLEGWLGKAIVDRILKRSVARAQGGVTPPAPTPAANGATPPAQPRSRFITDVEAWRAQNR